MRRAAWSAASSSPIVAMRQVPTGWTGPDVSYLTFTAQWDGQWYLHIAEQGYPRRLPTDASGLVQQNAWAFYPLFPFLSRVLMDLTHLDFYWVGSTLSLVLGFVAAGAMALLLRDRIGSPVHHRHGRALGRACRPRWSSRSATRRPWRWPCSRCSSSP